MEIANAGHTPAARSACAQRLALRFVATHEVDVRACARTGTPPAVATPAPRRSVQLPLIPARGSRDERRAIGLVVATASDLIEQGGILEASGAADGLRGGRYVMRRGGAVQLIDVRVVSDASVSGVLRITHQGLAGRCNSRAPGSRVGLCRSS